MKIPLIPFLCLSFLLTTHAQDMFVFKDGSIQTCYTVIKELPEYIQAEAKGRGQFFIDKKKLAYVQKANGQQLIYNGGVAPKLTLVDLQESDPEKCYHPKKSNVSNAIDNQTPGTKATVVVAQTNFFRTMCLTEEVQAYLVKDDEVTIEKADEIITEPPFIGSYLVSFKSKDGLILKGWVRRKDIVLKGR